MPRIVIMLARWRLRQRGVRARKAHGSVNNSCERPGQAYGLFIWRQMSGKEIGFNTNLSEPVRTQADFTYNITPAVISIVDTGLGQRSVTEDIEAEILPAHTICELVLRRTTPNPYPHRTTTSAARARCAKNRCLSRVQSLVAICIGSALRAVEESFRKWAISPRKQNIAKRFHSHPIGILVKAQKKLAGMALSLCHSTEVKKRNTKPTASKLTVLRQLLQSDSAASIYNHQQRIVARRDRLNRALSAQPCCRALQP